MAKPKVPLPLTEAFYYILIALYPRPSHGYGIMQDVEAMSGGRVKLGAGTLYTALNALLGKGMIEHYPVPDGTDARRKLYVMTEAGKEAAAAEMNRLEELLAAGRRIMQSGEA
ncbi:Transcriptional regulator PadR-like family protein [Paenibacillus sp. UNC496MF]|uniref:PadR family transcriptional regulator n=1 Tax=Paenibacillus sp. UNC496MF TaxID=1502753 RepID=UPI0008ED4AEE|nr:PadR family transcriptional regulator [Paenibacillus sp. UNC496MF]SFJ72895.1 Transcriptional regulator PadR-like family protein [Paenibacillus sp. UNC496MF]